MEKPIVDTAYGVVCGRVAKDWNGDEYYSFQGIPYAQPPVGQLRFKAPLPPHTWNGLKEVSVEGNQCYHRHLVYKTIVGAEDCLYLNVYTKSISNAKEQLKPVMVWIHGGSYLGGSGNEDFYGPQYLLTQDIVLVTINYRVGLLGFLSLEDPSLGVPGNAGLKDQVMALKWVQSNIEYFGGDPGNVTIFGESAGGACVHLLMLSPMAKGLFHKAIAQSGTALNPWSIGRRCSKELCDILMLNGPDERSLLEHLMKAPVDQILAAQEKLPDGFIASIQRAHGPVIERPVPNEPAFISQNPLDILLSGTYNKVPFMTGYTSREGMLFDVMSAHKGPSIYNIDFEQMVPYFLNYKRGSADSVRLAQKIKQFYFGSREANSESKEEIYVMKTDVFFLRGIYSSVKNHLLTSREPVYMYKFSVDAGMNLYKTYGQINSPGACHADELAYLFNVSVAHGAEKDSLEEKTIWRMIRLWTNFAKYGDPNPKVKDPLIGVEWKPVTDLKKINYLDIGDPLKAYIDPEPERMKFWDDVFKVHPAVSKL